MKHGFNFIFACAMFCRGLSCICVPHWWYKNVSPKQVAHDRKVFKVLGWILTPLGIAALLIELLRH